MNFEGLDLDPWVPVKKATAIAEPEVVTGSLQDDQNRRDFSVNAMAICLNKDRWGELLDPFGGIKDIEDKILHTARSESNIDDDPPRMMRAIRFAAQLNFKVSSDALMSIREMLRINIVAPERIAQEFNKI